jgi:EAL domain-containing protein (putative c-di-GMP-specific phosphodiesterase class I)/ActR/RegA family two-component response regulator
MMPTTETLHAGPSGAVDSQLILLIDDDVLITEALAAGLERDGRTVITCNDIEAAELVVERLRPSHVVADIRFSGPFGYEGLDFIRYVKRYAPESRIILISGEGNAALQLEASNRGAVAFLQKPFEVRELDATLDMITCSAKSAMAGGVPLIRVPLLEEILISDELWPLFQPIVALDAGRTVFGYESLTRFRSDSPLRNPDVLFQYAERKQRVAELECACIAKTMEAGRKLPAPSAIFVNVHPHVFASGPRLRKVLTSSAHAMGIALERVVLEITEQASLPRTPATLSAFAELRELGVRFAFDDVGVAYSHLPFIGDVRPAFLKISQDFGTAFEMDSTRRKIVANLLALANDFDCELILEGIEHETTAAAALDLGIALGQGFLFGRPAEAVSFAHNSGESRAVS